MVKMTLRSNESIQLAVRRFRKLVERSGLKREMRRRAYYEKPSEIKRRARLRACAPSVALVATARYSVASDHLLAPQEGLAGPLERMTFDHPTLFARCQLDPAVTPWQP